MSRQAGSGDVEGGGGELSDWFMEHYPGAFADYLRATGQWIVFVSGFGLVAVGVLCLCLSALVAPTGSWWLGTLDAFGVGFVVGGVVDVLAIWGLNQVQTRPQANWDAVAILWSGEYGPKTVRAAKILLARSGWAIVEGLRESLEYVSAEDAKGELEVEEQAGTGPPPRKRPPAGTPGNGDAPEVPP